MSTKKIEWAYDFQPKDVVRIKHGLPGKTGVVNRVDGESVNVFVTQNNPDGIGVWYNFRELKRIGRVR